MKRRKQLGGPAALVLAMVSAIAAACTVIAGDPVTGWPEMQTVEHRVPHNEMRERCARYVGFGMSPEACAEFNFAAGRCDLWFSADFPPAAYVVEHERQHCQGFEHAGEHELRAILAQYLASLQADTGSASQGSSSSVSAR
jgi:hypothetical protein